MSSIIIKNQIILIEDFFLCKYLCNYCNGHISDITAISGTPEFEINTTGTTSGAGTVYPFGSPALTPGF